MIEHECEAKVIHLTPERAKEGDNFGKVKIFCNRCQISKLFKEGDLVPVNVFIEQNCGKKSNNF